MNEKKTWKFLRLVLLPKIYCENDDLTPTIIRCFHFISSAESWVVVCSGIFIFIFRLLTLVVFVVTSLRRAPIKKVLNYLTISLVPIHATLENERRKRREKNCADSIIDQSRREKQDCDYGERRAEPCVGGDEREMKWNERDC